MRRRTFIKSTGASAAILGLAGIGSADDDHYRPRGPWPPNENAINYESYLDNEELADRLHGIDQRSDRVELREIGQSAGRNDPIWEVTLGDGDENVHMINGIHGDEPAGVEATLRVLERLAEGSSPEVEAILDTLSLTIVPDANPDGNEFRGDSGVEDEGDRIQRRVNTTEWEEGDSLRRPQYFYEFLDVGGYDLNRDFSVVTDFTPVEDEREELWRESDDLWFYDLPTDEIPLEPTIDDPPEVIENHGLRINPETRAVTESYLEADPDWALTHHHQGGVVDPDSTDESGPDWQTMMSVMAPQGPAYADISDDIEEGGGNIFMSEDAQKRSLQLGILAKDAMQARGGGRLDKINRFPYGPLWGSYEEALPPQTDAAALLYEVAHQSEDRGQMAVGTTINVTVKVYMETFRRIADGSIDEIDETRYFDEMSVASPPLENPHGR
ncbi:peptidase M14 [Natronococcus pandeyae]|uniref:Peptidase M14 n=1 Tax=Natronococcus pandeyae TaxID=2055836 RepID=A0A8J8Q0H9_9EURY|nr:M14 family metallopeptidase [Natronococcus pandeyae]TYL36253.1 peptidase M14 [Natronococcus pandeyae]